MSIFDRTKKIIEKMGASEQEERNISPPSVKQTTSKKKANPRSYMRNRGKGGSKPMSYYIPEEILTVLNQVALKTGVSKSDMVVEGLRHVLKDEIKEMRAKGEI